MSRVNLTEAKRLYDAAEQHWEFHDASKEFHEFVDWLRGNFAELLRLAWDNACGVIPPLDLGPFSKDACL